jgi:hypothetical protein
LRNVINAGRDAVDADSVADEQRLRWTAKSCGPDTPTLVSSQWEASRWRRWQTSPVTGESAKETVKTIARGMPGVSGVTVVTMLVCFVLFCMRGCGRVARPAFPAPFDWRVRKLLANLGRVTPRDREVVSASGGCLTIESQDNSWCTRAAPRPSSPNPVIPGWCVSTRPQMRNCASGNLEIPGSRWRAPRNDVLKTRCLLAVCNLNR